MGNQQTHAAQPDGEHIAEKVRRHIEEAAAPDQQIQRHGRLTTNHLSISEGAPKLTHQADARGIGTGLLERPAREHQSGRHGKWIGIRNIQIHCSQWIRQADLDVQHLVVKGIALQPPTFDHGRTHPVEVPCAGRGLLVAHPLKPLNVAVVDPVEDHQLITGIGLRITSPGGPEQHLHRELVLQEIDIADVGDVGTDPKRRPCWFHPLHRGRPPVDRSGPRVDIGLGAPSQLRHRQAERAGQSNPDKPPCPTTGPQPHASQRS